MPKLHTNAGNIASLVDPIWEQQPTESQKHFQMFSIYAAIPASQRSFAASWRQWVAGTKREGGSVSAYYRQLGYAWCWAERAAARDMHVITTQQTVWMERDRSRREEQFEMGQHLSAQAKRAINKIKNLPDEDFRVSLIEAKDVALAGAQLQEGAIPNLQLTGDQIQWVLAQLPPDKRADLMNRLTAAKKKFELTDGNTVDALVRDVTAAPANGSGRYNYGHDIYNADDDDDA